MATFMHALRSLTEPKKWPSMTTCDLFPGVETGQLGPTARMAKSRVSVIAVVRPGTDLGPMY
jgi:hypothetical protein